MSPRAQNMKAGADALGTAEKETGSAKHEKGTRRPRYRRKRVRERKHEKGMAFFIWKPSTNSWPSIVQIWLFLEQDNPPNRLKNRTVRRTA
jgi:hypothetical protein